MPATSDAIPLLGNLKWKKASSSITNFVYAKQPYINVDSLFNDYLKFQTDKWV